MSPWNRALRPLALFCVLAAGGCATVGPDFKAPAAPATAAYQAPGEAAAPGAVLGGSAPAGRPWWAALGSPALDAVIRQALADSPTVAEAEATLQRAQADLTAERGAGAPQVSAAASVQREKINTQAFGFTGFPSPTITLYSIGPAVSYDLDLFGGRRRAVEAAQADLGAEEQRAQAARLSLSGNVALQAARIAALRAQLAALDAVLADDRRLVEMVQAAEQAGGSPRAAISGGQSQLAEDEALAPPIRRQLAAARHQLALLVGKAPADWTAPDFDLAGFNPPAEIPVALPSALVRGRPDIAAAEAELHAATARIGVATAAEYPDLRLSASLTQGALSPSNVFKYGSSGWSLGPSLVAPLFDGGVAKARRHAAEAEARGALARYQATVVRAFVQVADALSALAHDDEEIAALVHARDAAEADLRDNQTAFRLGAGTFNTVVDAQRRVGLAGRRVVEAQGQRYLDLIALLAATASDWTPAPPPRS